MIIINTLVKIDPEFRRDSSGIPGGFQVDSAWNPPESSGIIAGIPPEFRWNSAGILAEFQTIPDGISVKVKDGIPLELLLAFRRDSALYSSWNSTGILRNYCRHSHRIPLEFRRNFSGIPDYSRRKFCEGSRWNPAGIIAGIPPGFCTVLQLEFHWNFTGMPD